MVGVSIAATVFAALVSLVLLSASNAAGAAGASGDESATRQGASALPVVDVRAAGAAARASHTAASKRRAAARKRRAAKRRARARRPCRSTRRGPVLRSPGYKGACKAPKTRPGAPLPPITLSSRGRFPDMVVDAAGTAHVVWGEEGGEAEDKLRYCRIKRGATGCDNPPATQSLFPLQPYGPGAVPAFNDDTAGPVVAAVGQDLALITFRYPIVVPKPDGPSSSTTYMWVSDDGGQTATGPAIVGNLGPSGGATVFGPADSP